MTNFRYFFGGLVSQAKLEPQKRKEQEFFYFWKYGTVFDAISRNSEPGPLIEMSSFIILRFPSVLPGSPPKSI